MATRLDKLLERIDPLKTLDKVSADVDQAVNSFSMGRATIDDWNEYESLLSGFCRHVEKTVLRLRRDVPDYPEFYWARCLNILNDEFGPSGSKTGFEMVRTGKNGGLYRILKIIAEHMAETYAQNEISARVNDYLNHLTSQEQLDAADEYVGKFGHLLPSEFKDGNAARLKVHFSGILKEHPKIIRRMRRIGR